MEQKIDNRSLWAWVAAALFAPAAQSLGSASWPWVLLVASVAGALWLLGAAATERGWRCGKAVAAMQILYLIFAVSVAASKSAACWITAKSNWTIPVVLLVLAATSAAQGNRAGARCGAMLYWFVAGMFLLLAAFCLPNVEVNWLRPGVVAPDGQTAAILLIPAAALLLPREGKGKAWPWAVAALVLSVTVSVLTIGTLSPKIAAQTEGAFFETVRGTSILGVAERFEALVAAAMTLSWFCLLSLFLAAIGHMAQKIHPALGKPSIWLSAAIAALVSPYAPVVPAALAAVLAFLLWFLLPALGRNKSKS